MFGLIASIVLGCSVPSSTPSLCFKDHVVVYAGHFEPEITRILDVARATAPMMGGDAIWITSANDSGHIIGSLHFQNKAFDIRIRNVLGHRAVEARLWSERIQATLGRDYDVVLALDHIHVEYDPKGD